MNRQCFARFCTYLSLLICFIVVTSLLFFFLLLFVQVLQLLYAVYTLLQGFVGKHDSSLTSCTFSLVQVLTHCSLYILYKYTDRFAFSYRYEY